MAKLNRKIKTETPKVRANAPLTHGGAFAEADLSVEQQLRRSVCSCLLWEDTFYESGKDIADRIVELALQAHPGVVAKLAIEARSQFNLRHVPLLLLSVLAKTGSGSSLVSNTIAEVIQRADEVAEFLAIYAKMNGMTPDKLRKISAQVKKGIGRALQKFDQYQLTKYNREGAVTLRDAAFLVHAKPANDNRGRLIANLVNKDYFPETTKSGFHVIDRLGLQGTPHLDAPETWEVELSAGKDKKKTFQELLKEDKLGYMALLRNLRGMTEAGVDETLVRNAILARKGAHRVLPFRFLSAAKHAPRFESVLDQAMLANLAQMPKLPGKTILIVDVSGSMYGRKVSEKSEIDRAQAACSVAAIAREMCEQVVIYATAGSDVARRHKTELVPDRHGMALIQAIYEMCRPLGGGGIFLKQVIDYVLGRERSADRIIVITDEQDCGVGHLDSPTLAEPFGRHNYLINVANYRNGIGYGKWTHIDGFSEHVLRFIAEAEFPMCA